MSFSCEAKVLAEAAGVKIVMTSLNEDDQEGRFTEKIILTRDNVVQSCGFHLSKSKWDPYPWVGHVESGSIADLAGLRAGDCLLNVDGKDLVGLKIKDIAILINGNDEARRTVCLSVWRYREEIDGDDAGLALKGPLPDVAKKLADVLSGTVRALECPICLESAVPPVSQCVHGHILCVTCRPKTARCPVCRVRLGQGRCLLADNIHRIFSDSFVDRRYNENTSDERTTSLRQRLFGHKRQAGRETKSNGRASWKPRQLLLARLLQNGLGKAASAENLTTALPKELSRTEQSTSLRLNTQLTDRLSLQDRAKSASTGELSREEEPQLPGESLRASGLCREIAGTSGSLSLPETPVWGGSVDSMAGSPSVCPFSIKYGCGELISPRTLPEHLKTHDVPQIHFYRAHVVVPISSPFGFEVIYILHYKEDVFYFQYDDEAAWMTSTATCKNWEWSLHGRGGMGTQVKLFRSVASLEDPLTLTAKHVAPLPKQLALHSVEINLLDSHSNNGINI